MGRRGVSQNAGVLVVLVVSDNSCGSVYSDRCIFEYISDILFLQKENDHLCFGFISFFALLFQATPAHEL